MSDSPKSVSSIPSSDEESRGGGGEPVIGAVSVPLASPGSEIVARNQQAQIVPRSIDNENQVGEPQQSEGPPTSSLATSGRRSEEAPQPDEGYAQISDGIFMSKTPLKKGTRMYKGYQQHASGDRRPLAIKMITPCHDMHLREVRSLLKLASHSNIVQIVHSEERQGTIQRELYIVMELCSTQNLQDFFNENQKRKIPFDVNKAMSFAKQLVSALKHIHNLKIIHRDLKPENILLSVDGQTIKVSDFGISKQMRSGRPFTRITTPGQGTEGYKAPETFKSDVLSQSADIFCLGLILYAIFSNGKHAFGQDVHLQNYNIINNQGRDFSGLLISGPKMHELLDLLNQTLEKDPEKRLTIEQVSNHAFFTNMQTSTTEARPEQTQAEDSANPLAEEQDLTQHSMEQAFDSAAETVPKRVDLEHSPSKESATNLVQEVQDPIHHSAEQTFIDAAETVPKTGYQCDETPCRPTPSAVQADDIHNLRTLLEKLEEFAASHNISDLRSLRKKLDEYVTPGSVPGTNESQGPSTSHHRNYSIEEPELDEIQEALAGPEERQISGKSSLATLANWLNELDESDELKAVGGSGSGEIDEDKLIEKLVEALCRKGDEFKAGLEQQQLEVPAALISNVLKDKLKEVLGRTLRKINEIGVKHPEVIELALIFNVVHLFGRVMPAFLTGILASFVERYEGRGEILQNNLNETQRQLVDLEKALACSDSSPDSAKVAEMKLTDKQQAEMEKKKGTEYLKTGDFENGHKHYDAANRCDPTNIALYSNKALAYQRQKLPDKVREMLQKVIELGKEHGGDKKVIAKAYMRIGQTYMDDGKFGLALENFEFSRQESDLPEVQEKIKQCRESQRQQGS